MVTGGARGWVTLSVVGSAEGWLGVAAAADGGSHATSTPRARGPAGRELHPRGRLLDPQRRAARDRGRRRPRSFAPAVDRDVVRALRGRLHAAVRPDRRPVRPPAAVPARDGAARRLLAGGRCRRLARAAAGRARRPRARDRGGHPGRAVAAHHHVRRRAAARAGARAQRRADGGRVHDRRRARRAADRRAELALGVLRQRGRRDRRARGGAPGDRREPAGRAAAARRHRSALVTLALLATVYGIVEAPLALVAAAALARRLPRGRGAGRAAARPARDPAPPHGRRGQPRRRCWPSPPRPGSCSRSRSTSRTCSTTRRWPPARRSPCSARERCSAGCSGRA